MNQLAEVPQPDEPAQTAVKVIPPECEAIGAKIQSAIEEIFGRACDGMPIYEKLGGLESIAATLGTHIPGGISSDSVELRRSYYGKNELPQEEQITFWQILKDAWSDHMILLLSAAAVVALVLGLTVPEAGEDHVNRQTGWIEGFSILLSVLIVTTVSSVNDYRKELEFRRLTEENAAQPIQVIRDGVTVTVDVTEIVVGDLVVINPGLVMPFDGFYVSGIGVVVDESSVTGENDPKKKNPRAPFFLAGTIVNTAEHAVVLASAVGARSFGGKLLLEARGDGEVPETPLQIRLDDLADLVGRLGIGAALVLFIALCIIEGVKFARDNPEADGQKFLDYFLLCVAIVVVAVPEGLPLAVTISLAYSQRKMQQDNNQVRRLAACETMGNTTQICSDKTGTLTQNCMSVVQGHIGAHYLSVAKPGDFPERITAEGIPRSTIDMLCEAIAVNSSSNKVFVTLGKDNTPLAEPKWTWELDKGNKTDNALLDFCDRLQLEGTPTGQGTLPHQKIRQRYPAEKFTVFPFTSERKRMSAIVVRDDCCKHYVKGAAEQILPLCEHEVAADGTRVPLTDDRRALIKKQISSLASNANRNIGVAFADLPLGSPLPDDEPTEPLTWLALIGIQDPLRPEVSEAVRKCQHAGVVVRMCTGDNIETAIAIAKQCGIYSTSRGDIAMTGAEFRKLVYSSFGDDARMKSFWRTLDKMAVMARSQPLDKQLLVLMLMCRGEVVAVTGDGTNDAPALRLANVGFVMRSGTDVAIKSSDIILLDDNFRSVQRAVVWGRTVNDNIRKFLQLQLTINVVSVLLTFIGSLQTSTNASPLTTVQLLWLNLIMDTLAALALATEEPSEQCLDRGPLHRKTSLVTRRMWTTILTASAYSLACTLVILNVGHEWFAVGPRFEKGMWLVKNNREHLTIVFNIFVYSALFQMLNARKLYTEKNIFEGFRRSWSFVIIFMFCCGFQALAVEVFGDFMNVTSLNWKQWLGCIAASTPVIPLVILSRFLPIPEEVFPSDFNTDELKPEALKMVERLKSEVQERAASPHITGMETQEALERAQKLRATALWHQLRVQHVGRLRVVSAFRRAAADKDVRNRN